MRSGRLRDWVTFEREVVTRNDFNEAVRTWVPVVETWAQVKSVSGQQDEKSGKDTHTHYREIYVRPQDMALNEKMRIIFNGRVHSIQSMDENVFKGDVLMFTVTVDS
jgi:SPP1 family predicted phage head-tail adaptor